MSIITVHGKTLNISFSRRYTESHSKVSRRDRKGLWRTETTVHRYSQRFFHVCCRSLQRIIYEVEIILSSWLSYKEQSLPVM